MSNVLVLAAHPDDEVLGCAGHIAWHVRQGDSVYVAFMTDGAGNRYEPEKVELCKKQAQSAAQTLSLRDLVFLDFPNQRLETVAISEMAYALEQLLEKWQIDCFYTHDRADLNRDHQLCYEASIIAARPLPGSLLKTLASYYVPSSSEYREYSSEDAYLPNQYLDLEKDLDLKWKALQCYSTELCEYPHPRSEQGLRINAQSWGLRCGKRFAEPMKILRHCLAS